MGEVHLCEDRQIGRRIAVKTLRADRKSSAAAMARFVREARVQGQLEHPAVLPVYDLGIDTEGDVYFTMKRVRGETLEDVISGLARGDETLVAEYDQHRLLSDFARICLAVHFANEHGVVHRDLKPANVMLGDYGEVYVVDWGLAKVLTQKEVIEGPEEEDGRPSAGQTRAGALLGTPGYMAPEQARGEKSIDAAADVYALGSMLFEMLTLVPLHRGNLGRIMASTIGGVQARPSIRAPLVDVAPELEEICVRATATDTAERYPSARALHDAIEAYLKGTRDAELRRQASRDHADRAAAHSADTLDGRRQAMQELGRALALDPENAAAFEMLAGFLAEPPKERPPEVDERLETSDHRAFAQVGRIAAIAYASVFCFIPIIFWHGVRRPSVFLAFFGLAAVCAGLSYYASTREGVPTSLVVVIMLMSSTMFLCLWPLYGTLLLVAPAVISNAVGFSLLLTGRWRVVTIGLGVLYIVGPVVLEMLGVFEPSLIFRDGIITIVPNVVELRELPTLALLCVSSTTSLVIACATAGGVRAQLRKAEERLYLHDWQVRALVPAPE